MYMAVPERSLGSGVEAVESSASLPRNRARTVRVKQAIIFDLIPLGRKSMSNVSTYRRACQTGQKMDADMDRDPWCHVFDLDRFLHNDEGRHGNARLGMCLACSAESADIFFSSQLVRPVSREMSTWAQTLVPTSGQHTRCFFKRHSFSFLCNSVERWSIYMKFCQ